MPKSASPISPTSPGRKRPYPSAESSIQQATAPQPQLPSRESAVPSSSNLSSSFRNVSACNRCRLRKNRCDHQLPSCQSCEKAGVRCVGYDPITKREIPRSYVYFLETRVAYLEKVLMDNQIEFKEAVAFDEEVSIKVETKRDLAQPRVLDSEGSISVAAGNDKGVGTKEGKPGLAQKPGGNADGEQILENKQDHEKEDNWPIHNLVSNIGIGWVQGHSDPRYQGSTSGISFARVVLAAVKSSVSGNMAERGSMRPTERLPHSATGTAGSTMRDSFFGLQTRPMMKCATFPDRELAEKLANLYFEHANPQIPILHRPDFMELLDRTYSVDEKSRSPRSLYMLNIVFAIGAGIIFEEKPPSEEEGKPSDRGSPSAPTSKRPRLSGHQHQPEEYHASAVIHLESFIGSSSSGEGFGALEELQAVLLLASFALLRPVAPGLWYIVGVAMRLAVDLGLHYEDGTGLDSVGEKDLDRSSVKDENKAKLRIHIRERGRREWVRDLRRRLWWCAYSLDRLVSCSVGRPFGISDQAISTEFPSLSEDMYITKSGISAAPEGSPSYKHAAHHYFKLRLLQSEIQDVLQHQQARFVRQRVPHSRNNFTRSDLSSPFLQGFDSFRSWRRDVHRRLKEWQESAPTRCDTGVQFAVEFLELNYWQAVIMLYQQSLTVPAELAGELTPAEGASSPSFPNVDEAEDEDDIHYKIAEAGQKVIRIYRQMHHVRLVNYTYLATHHIFMAGISFLYAIWHSPIARSRLTLDDVDFTILAATSVLSDLRHKCPPAEACRDAFERMSKATIQMSLSTTGFGSQVDLTRNANAPQQANTTDTGRPQQSEKLSMEQEQQQPSLGPPRRQTQSRPLPRFDMNLGDRFNETTPPGQSTSHTTSTASFAPDQLSRPHPQSSMEYYGQYENIQSPQMQQQYYYTNSPHQSMSPNSVAPNPSPRQFPNVDQEIAARARLNFLDFDSRSAETQVPFGSDGNPDTASLGYGVGHSVGIDLGFGMAVDFQHDWSENAHYDMLEGYFFGGSGAGLPGDEIE